MSRLYSHITMNCRTCDIDPTIHEAIARMHAARTMEVDANDIVSSMARHYGETDRIVQSYREIVRTCEAIVAAAFNDLVTLVNDAHARPFNLTTATIHAFGNDHPCDKCSQLDLTSMSDRAFVLAVNANHAAGTILASPHGDNDTWCDWCREEEATHIVTDTQGFMNRACVNHMALWTFCTDTVSVIVRPSKNV